MENKVVFGLENVHVAFQKQLPGKTFAVLTAPSATGDVTVTVTAADLDAGTPVPVVVAVDHTTDTTAAAVATKIVAALNADTDVKVNYIATAEGSVVILKRKEEPETPDATFAVAIAPALTGVTTSEVLATYVLAFGSPQPQKGAVNLALDPEGEDYNFYADNGPYYSITSNNGYSGDLELAKLDDALAVPMLGYLVDDAGMVVEIADGEQKPFALLCQFKGDKKNRKMIFFNVKASRPNEEHATTEEGVEVTTQVLPLVIQPIEINGKNIVKGSLELLTTPSAENTLAYNNFFYQVILPEFS